MLTNLYKNLGSRIDRESAFSMMEVLVTCLIVTILACIAIPAFAVMKATGQDQDTLMETQSISMKVQAERHLNQSGGPLPTLAQLDYKKTSNGSMFAMVSDSSGTTCILGYNEGGQDYKTSDTAYTIVNFKPKKESVPCPLDTSAAVWQ